MQPRGMIERRILLISALVSVAVFFIFLYDPPASPSQQQQPQLQQGPPSHAHQQDVPTGVLFKSTTAQRTGAKDSASIQFTGGTAVATDSICNHKQCGCAIADTFGLRFAVAESAMISPEDYRVVIVQTAGNTTDLSWSARAICDEGGVMVASHPPRVISPSSRELLAAWEFNFWLPSSQSSCKFDVEITLTWINDFTIGTRWKLPNRDDNPPLQEKKRKCLALELVGDCERFGMTVLRASVTKTTTTTTSSTSDTNNNNNNNRRPLCTTTQDFASNGAWHRYTDDEWTNQVPSDMKDLIDDFVGLNRFRGGVWHWEPRHCRLRWLRREEALRMLTLERGVRQLTLFGDSMLLEQFLNLRRILEPKSVIRNFRQQRLRCLSFTTTAFDDVPSLTVTFLRSYTTSAGKSVIAAPGIVANQVLATKPDVIVGNAAVLHWQQNSRSLADWAENVKTLARKLCHHDSLKLGLSSSGNSNAAHKKNLNTKSTRTKPNLIYWGPTLIQMGRTQGLQPHRTMAFGVAGRDAFENECGENSRVAALVHQSQSTSSTSRLASSFWTYNASISRRESAHDGQHWACYREFGGVAATFAQMFLNLLVN